jgi:hypothetical protein
MTNKGGQDVDWKTEFDRLNRGSLPTTTPPAGTPGGQLNREPLPTTTPPAGTSRGQKRKHDRFPLVNARVELFPDSLFTTIGLRKENLARTLLDLCEGGAGVLVHQRLKVDTKVKIRIEIEKFGDAIEASGVIRWCFESGTKAGEFRAGIMFTNPDGALKRKIAVMRDWFTSSKCIALKGAQEPGVVKPLPKSPQR